MKTIYSKKNSTTSVLITGGSGFVGANMIKYFLSQQIAVHCIVRSSTNLWRLSHEGKSISFYDISLRDRGMLKKLAEKINPSVIVHLAAYGNNSSDLNIDKAVETNIIGTVNLLFATKDIPYKAFINTGSSSEYGFKSQPMKETDCLEPNSVYSATKASSTYLVQVFSRDFNKPIVTLRPFSIYGPYESGGRLISNIMIAMIKNEPINLSPGKAKHDYIYIDDLVRGYVAAIKNIKNICGQVINLGTSKEYTNRQVVDKLFQVAHKRVDVHKGSVPKRVWDNPHWSANIDLAERLLRWQPEVDIDQGLQYTYQWFQKNINLYD